MRLSETETTEKKPLWRRCLTPLLIGSVLLLMLAWYYDLFHAGGTAELLKRLSDCFLVAAVPLLGLGVLSFVASFGFFDLLGFASFSLFGVFIPRKEEERSHSFYEYKQKKDSKGRYWLPQFLLVGAIFLLLAMLCAAVRNVF